MRGKLKPFDLSKGNPKFSDLLKHSIETDKRLAQEAEAGGATDDFGETFDVGAIETERDNALARVKELEQEVADIKERATKRVGELKAELEAAQSEIKTLKAPVAAKKSTKAADTPKE